VLSNTDHHTAIEELETLAEQAQPPLIRMEHTLHGIVAFGIMPIFALANAGVSLAPDAMAAAATNAVTLGALAGLVVGKPLGIVGFSWLAVRSGMAALPAGASWPMLTAVGVLGGIGFTMALFIAGLAFGTGPLLDAAKLGVIAGSALTGAAGWLWLRRLTSSRAPTSP
jgi:NhaA family Na+:H+ antiporter